MPQFQNDIKKTNGTLNELMMECFHPHYQQSAVEVMCRCIKGMARGSGDVLKSYKKGPV